MNKQLLFQWQKKQTFRVTLAVLESAISNQKLSFVDFLLARAKVFLQSKYSAHSAYYLGMTYINRERIALLESKFPFQTEYCNVLTVALRNTDWLITDIRAIRQMFTRKWQTVSGLLCLM